MIRTLRRKFTAAAMLSLALVLLVLLGTVNLFNYRSVAAEADETLLVLGHNQGRFPRWMIDQVERSGGVYREEGKPPVFWGETRMKLSPELPFESRFFSVLLDASGVTLSQDLEHIAAVSGSQAATMAAQAAATGRESGYLGSYRFRVTALEERDIIRVTFLDCTRGLATARSFLLASLVMSLVCLVAVLLLTVWLAGRFTRPVAESYEKQRRFITDAGHELRTPLTIINADTELLGMELPENEWLQDIRLQTERLSALTNDLIFLSRMDEERQRLEKLDFPLSDMVSETVQAFRARALTEEKSICTEIVPMLTYCGDERSLRQLVNVLMDNALKYSPAGSDIRVKLEHGGRNVTLRVENLCESLPEGDLRDLFDRFHRGGEGRRGKAGGYGLGLSVAKAVAEAHRGKIKAEISAPGTIAFTVTLPEG